MPLFCKLFGHLRSRFRAYFDEDDKRWKSWCERCETPLVREKDGKWRER